MNCERYEAGLIDLARGALDDSGMEASVRDHLGTREPCAERFARERELTEGLRALSAATVVPANDLAERRLMTAFASTQPGAPATAPHSMAVRWAVWAAAACIFFFVGAWAAVEWRARTPEPGGAAAQVQAARSPAAEEPTPVPGAERPVVAPTPVVAERPRARASRVLPAGRRNALPEETDRLADFVPLPAAGGLPGFDSGMIVRVSLPTASLPAYGLAITPESASTVNADLLVGQDGQARAIRLVSLVGGTRRGPQ